MEERGTVLNIEFDKIATAITQNDWDKNTTIQAGKYKITQFQGTAFDSDYKCYKVCWDDGSYNGPMIIPAKRKYEMAAKITTQTEADALKLLAGVKAPVPRILRILRSQNDKDAIMLFEQIVPGAELYSISDSRAWIATAEALAKIHLNFLHTDVKSSEVLPKMCSSPSVYNRIQTAISHVAHNENWKKYMGQVVERLNTAPITLSHGDMFPTNVLIKDNRSCFIDWADSCICAYMMDIGRLTGTIDVKTLKPMCPCTDDVIKAYYKKLHSGFDISYDRYLQDVKMAQFIELAKYYSPSGVWNSRLQYNTVLKEKIDHIVNS